MEGTQMLILDPTGKRKSSGGRLAARPEDLKGLTVGLLDHGTWVTWEMVSRHYKKMLKERHGVGDVIYLNVKKQNLEKGASREETVEELASKCDVVILGLGN